MMRSNKACKTVLLAVSNSGHRSIESEYPELEGTLKDHQVQLLAPHKSQTICLRALSRCFLHSDSLGLCPLAWAAYSVLTALWLRIFSLTPSRPSLDAVPCSSLGPYHCHREQSPALLLYSLWGAAATMRSPLSLPYCGLSMLRDLHCSSCALPSRLFTTHSPSLDTLLFQVQNLWTVSQTGQWNSSSQI